MTDLLQAISNIVSHPIPDILNYYKKVNGNRINDVGNALEEFIKDAFAGTIQETDLSKKVEKYSQTFSWLGNKNNPPDLIIKSGDAVEVKKITSLKSQIALNSSYPKAKLFASDPMITADCRNCEQWTEKEIIYAIGIFISSKLKVLWLIDGCCYAASAEYYQRIKNKISQGINEIEGVEFSVTKELGRVNQIDPLGITYLRIRGMWGIDNPIKVYNYLNLDFTSNDLFQLIAMMPEEKFLFLQKKNPEIIKNIVNMDYIIKKSKIKSPNNPAKMMDVRIINHI